MIDTLRLRNGIKPLLKVINNYHHQIYQIMEVDEDFFFPKWHFHPECELMLVLEGTGIRFVGDSIKRFQAGDLVFHGSDLPHFYRSDDEYYQKKSNLRAKAIVLYFKEEFLGNVLGGVNGVLPLKKMIANSKRGIRFKGKIRDEIIKEMKKLNNQKDDLSKIIDLLIVLKIMSTAGDIEYLSSIGFNRYIIDDYDFDRITKVCQYIINNFSENPILEEVAAVANMSETAFCRYFKSHTNKTYTQFLNEIKIGNACKLLVEKEMSISSICYEVGFNNFTHFNKSFKKSIGLSPREYQQKYLTGVRTLENTI